MRLFVGTLLSPPNQSFYDGFVARLVATEGHVLRPIPSGSAHLTFVFCADVPNSEADALGEAVRRVSAGERSFPIELAGPHVVLAGRTPRLVCADVAGGAGDLGRLTASLMQQIGARCPGLDLRPTRSPHLTLARFRRQTNREDAERVTGALERLGGPEMKRDDRVRRLQVIESTLTPSQPTYTVRVDAPCSDATVTEPRANSPGEE